MNKIPPITIRDVYLEITNTCNLKCPHCYRLARNKDEDLPLKEITKRFKLAEKLQAEHVFLTGGEPLLHQKIDKIIERGAQYDFKLIIITNGTVSPPKNVELVNVINVSLEFYGIKQNKFRNKPHLFSHIGKFLDSLKGKVQRNILSTLIAENRSEYAKLINYAEKHADAIVFDRYVPYQSFPSSYNAQEYQEVLKFLYDAGKTSKVPVVMYEPLFFAAYPEKGTSRFRCKSRLFVRADGRYSICPFFPQYFNTIEEALNERKQESLPTECEGCTQKDSCHGGCPATRMSMNKTLSIKDPLCFMKI